MIATTQWQSLRRVLCAVGVAVGFAICAGPAKGQTLPALPTLLNTSYPTMTGTTISVQAGGDLQGALNQAQLGDTIVLQAGATYSGTFTLNPKSGSGWIVIRTSAPDSSLPAQGRRISPANASLLPKIVATNSAPAIQTTQGAHHYRLVGLEITVASSVTLNYGLVALGDDSTTSLSQVPSFLVLDRVYVHGQPNNNMRRGVAFNCASCAVVDSYIADAHEAGADAQAIAGWNGPGPFKIVNNYLSGAGENVLFGGADPAIANMVPSDIEVRGNYFYKPVAWKSASWTVKNLFELKNAQRVLAEGNIFEHNWPNAQNGYSILFTVRNQDGSAPWSVVQDVTFRNNIVRGVSSAVNILGTDDLHPSQQTKRILVTNNLFDDVSGTNWGGYGRLLQVLDGAADVTLDHNTAFQTGEIIVASGTANTRFTYRNNLTPHNLNGVGGDNYYGNPAGAISTYFPGSVFTRNVLQGGNAANYPTGNFFPTTMNNVGFVNFAGGDYRLQTSSPYSGAGTDGKDVGADLGSVNAATSGVLNGTTPGGSPGDTTPPSVAITAPSNGATVSGVTTLSADASDNVGVAGVQFFVDGSTLGAEDFGTPYTASWNTSTATNGTHTVSAVARDAAGNRTTSASVTVTVANSNPDTTPPAVAITTPANGATVSGTTTISASASDNVGVSGVQFFVDGSRLGTEDTVAPYGASWDTTKVANGSHRLTAIARDAAGNTTTSVSVSATVANAAATQSPYYGTPFQVPGQFEAEDFDKGGEGVAYHDLTPGNQGGLYRITEDVDIISPYAGGYVVNNFQTGEWLEYTINVTASGTYRVEALVSSIYTTSRYHVEIDGMDKTGAIDVPNTGAWVTFQWVGKDGIRFPAGRHTLRIVADIEYFNLDAIRISTVAAGRSPFSGTPAQVPGQFEAEDFDKGGEGVAYHDLTPGNQGGFYRITEDVDIISPYAFGFAVNNFQTGEWLKYTINVSQSGLYRIEALVSSMFTASRFHVEIDGADKTGGIDVPNTGSWGTFQWVGNGGISLSAGQHVLRLSSDIEYFNVDALRLTQETAPADTTPPAVAITAPSSGATVNGIVQVTASASDNVGVAGVRFYVDGSAWAVEDTTAPFAVSWDTTTAANGSHKLTAVARDASGNSTTSASVQVMVANGSPDTTPPAVAITAPNSGATVNGSVQVTASASDNVGVAGVRFYVDGSAWGVEDTTAPFAVSWDTTTAANGSHKLTAVARDASGNSATSAALSIFVSNAPQTGPYKGTPSKVPGRIEAENFDLGGEGVAYHDLTPGNQGGYYRTDEDVDIVNPYAFGYVVNNVQTGEWLNYTINVAQAGTYRFDCLVSSQVSTSGFHIEVDGVDKTGLLTVPNTGSWGSYRWVGKGGISLSAGRHVLKIYAASEYFNFDVISSSLEVAATPVAPRRRASPRH